MSVKRAIQLILLALVAMAIAIPAWGDEIHESGRLPEVSAEEGETDALSDILRSEELSLGLIAGALALALFLGAAHGLEPGHGKTIVAAYLIGSRGTVGNALSLGGIVTFTHTFSVILLGLVALFASQYILPEQIFPWLGTASGLLIIGLGTWLLVNHLRGRGFGHSHEEEHHGHHDHSHEEEHHGHSHEIPSKVTLGSLLTLGISGGIVPCPGALVILLLAVALHRIAFGLLLLVAFSVGLAAILIAIGVLIVKARPLVERFSGDGRWIQRLPIASAVVIIVVGCAITLGTLMDSGVILINV